MPTLLQGRFTHATGQWTPSLRVIGVECLLKAVAGARSHLVHTCTQEIKSHFQRRVSITLSPPSTESPQAAPLTRTHNTRQMCYYGIRDAFPLPEAASSQQPGPFHGPSQAQDFIFRNWTTHTSFNCTDQANGDAHTKEQEVHFDLKWDREFST